VPDGNIAAPVHLQRNSSVEILEIVKPAVEPIAMGAFEREGYRRPAGARIRAIIERGKGLMQVN